MLRRSFLAIVAGLLVLAPGCAPTDEPPPDRSEDALAVTVDGFPVDCLLEQTIRTGPTAVVQTAARDGATVEVWLGDADVSAELTGTPPTATLDIPDGEPVRLRVVSRENGGSYECTARLVQRASMETALDTLREASEDGLDYTTSDETGAPSNLTLRVPTTGATPSERAADFLARHAAALGAPADQLVERDVDVASDGWAVVSFDQVIGGVPGHRAGVDVQMNAEGAVVSVHARLFVDLHEAPSFVSDEAAVRAAAQDAGDIGGVERVLFDPARPRAAWRVDGLSAIVVVDDMTLEIVESMSTVDDATVEIHHPNPNPLPTGDRGEMMGHTTVASASSAGRAPDTLNAVEKQVWAWAAKIAENVRAGSGKDGWEATSHPSINIDRITPGAVRFMVESMSTDTGRGRGWYSYGLVYLGHGSATEAAVVCHEYGHALHDTLRKQATEAGSIKEAVADVFWQFCDPWLTGSHRTGYRGQNFASPPGGIQSDYDAFRAAGLTADTVAQANVHAHTYLLSHPFYQLLHTYRTPTDRAEQLAYFTLGYNRAASTERFRAFRDAIVTEADTWARNGRHGFTEADVCNVARAFRDVKLDGEYGQGTDPTCGTGGSGGEGDRYVCTGAYCPLCPVENPNPCATEPTENEPHCIAPGLAGAGDRRICVGALALTGEGCQSGQLHHCWCQADGSWDCPEECRDPGDVVAYCPETSGGGGGYTRNDCSVSPGARHSPALWLGVSVVFGWVFARRRRRSA